jgi:hypothetical protein
VVSTFAMRFPDAVVEAFDRASSRAILTTIIGH